MYHIQNQTLDLLYGHQSIHPQSSPSQDKNLGVILISSFSSTLYKIISNLVSSAFKIYQNLTMSYHFWTTTSKQTIWIIVFTINALATLCFHLCSFHSVYLHGSKTDFWTESLTPFSTPSSEFLSHLHYIFNLL